jgi:hypothetical protein
MVYPDVSVLMGSEPLKYFATRADAVKDPGAKATYLDFLWESRRAGVDKPAEYARRAVTAYLAAASDHEARGSFFQASAAYNRTLQLGRSISDLSQTGTVLKVMNDYASRLAGNPETLRYLLEIGEGLAAHARDLLSEQGRRDWQGWAEQAAGKFASEGGDSRVLERRFLELKLALSPDNETRRAIAESFEAEPQIEDLFRQVLRAAGRPVTARNGTGGFRKRSLSTLFEQEIGILRRVFGTSYCNYAYCFLLDPRAENLRNKVAHGLLKPEDSDKTTAHIVFHHVIVLGLLRRATGGAESAPDADPT